MALAIFLLGTTAARAQTHTHSPDAILRCDPGTLIQDIDGFFKSYYPAGEGIGFKECAIPLTKGPHTLQVCISLGGMNGSTTVGGKEVSSGGFCHEKQELTLDAVAGRTYRLKFDRPSGWKAFIVDVTDDEAGLSYEEPPKKPKPTGSKKERETILVMRATPTNAMLGVQKGVIRGKWFDARQFGALKLFNVSRQGVPNGYHIFRAHGGDTVAFLGGQQSTDSVFRINFFHPCGDFRVRVYEDIPPGKVLYLGHMNIQAALGGYVGNYIDDLEEARAYINAHHPELAGRLEAAPFREALTPNLCYGAGSDLVPSL